MKNMQFESGIEVLFRTGPKEKWKKGICVESDTTNITIAKDEIKCKFNLLNIDTFEAVRYNKCTAYLLDTRRNTYKKMAEKWIFNNHAKAGDLVIFYIPNETSLECVHMTKKGVEKCAGRIGYITKVNYDGTFNIIIREDQNVNNRTKLYSVPYLIIKKLHWNDKNDRKLIDGYERRTGVIVPEREIEITQLRIHNRAKQNQSKDEHTSYAYGMLVDNENPNVVFVYGDKATVTNTKKYMEINLGDKGVIRLFNEPPIKLGTIVLVSEDTKDWVLGTLSHVNFNENTHSFEYKIKGNPLNHFKYCIEYKGNEEKLNV